MQLASSALHECITHVDRGSNYDIESYACVKHPDDPMKLSSNSSVTRVSLSSLNWSAL